MQLWNNPVFVNLLTMARESSTLNTRQLPFPIKIFYYCLSHVRPATVLKTGLLGLCTMMILSVNHRKKHLLQQAKSKQYAIPILISMQYQFDKDTE